MFTCETTRSRTARTSTYLPRFSAGDMAIAWKCACFVAQQMVWGLSSGLLSCLCSAEQCKILIMTACIGAAARSLDIGASATFWGVHQLAVVLKAVRASGSR